MGCKGELGELGVMTVQPVHGFGIDVGAVEFAGGEAGGEGAGGAAATAAEIENGLKMAEVPGGGFEDAVEGGDDGGESAFDKVRIIGADDADLEVFWRRRGGVEFVPEDGGELPQRGFKVVHAGLQGLKFSPVPDRIDKGVLIQEVIFEFVFEGAGE